MSFSMTKIFPKARIQFCKTADGTNVYRVWRYCGKAVLNCWFSLEPVQTDEASHFVFDVRELIAYTSPEPCIDPPDAKTSCAAIQSVTDQEIRDVTGYEHTAVLNLSDLDGVSYATSRSLLINSGIAV